MTRSRDPYEIGYDIGSEGQDLPDELFSLFSWIGWLRGLEAHVQATYPALHNPEAEAATPLKQLRA